MKTRNIEHIIKKYSKQFPIIGIVGPRQSGKTTLAKKIFSDYQYVNLENIDARQYAETDPRGFLHDYSKHIIIDEIQRCPNLFSYLQQKVDEDDSPAQYVLTGSQQFLLLENVSQSLAGRIATFKLMPFTLNELIYDRQDSSIEGIFTVKKRDKSHSSLHLHSFLFSGLYPRIHDKKIDPRKWIENYISTYIERDIRSIINVSNLKLFETFLQMLASQTGQILNYNNISNAVGVSLPTIKSWISILETSGIIFLQRPYYKNYSKRLIKSPKLYFIDTGIVCFLLSIRHEQDLASHPLIGNLFETFIIGEFYKRICHIGEIPPMYFWRDKTGTEIDLLIDLGNKIFPIEIKYTQTYTPHLSDSITKWQKLVRDSDVDVDSGMVIYRGDTVYGKTANVSVVPWNFL